MSLAQRRGIESIDLNQNILLVKAPIESVASAFNQARRADIWERDVYDQEVEIIGQSFVLFQLREHLWTLIYELTLLPQRITFGEEDAQTLSQLLHTRAIFYIASDTCGYIGYNLYEDGEFKELLYFEEGSSVQFQSQRRQLDAKDIKDAYSFTHDFLQEQNVYVPDVNQQQIPRVSQRVILRLRSATLKHLVPNELERLDYIVLK